MEGMQGLLKIRGVLVYPGNHFVLKLEIRNKGSRYNNTKLAHQSTLGGG